MLTFEEAREIALAHIGSDCVLVESSIAEKPYGWYFYSQSREFAESGDMTAALVGSSGFIVERDGGRIFEFGSAYPAAEWLKNYEKGFKYHAYDLTILSVRSLDRSIELLEKLDMTYIVPESAQGVTWKIPQRYTSKDLRRCLSVLPAQFTNQMFWHRVGVFDEMARIRCMTYEIREAAEAKQRAAGDVRNARA